MVVNHQYTRTDTLELRDLIFRNIGHQRADKYFDIMKRLFSFRISKIEFNKLCVRTIGHANLPLHNRLINSILKNACLAKVPPPKLRKLGTLFGDAHQRRPSPSRQRQAFPVDRGHNYQDVRNPLTRLAKCPGNAVSQRVPEQQSATELNSLGSRPPIEGASTEDGEEVEQVAGSPSIQSRSPVTAPLGISTNITGARKAVRSRFGSGCSVYLDTGGLLPDTSSLKIHLEKRLQLEGIDTSLDSVNLLNNGIDVYMKKLIEPCIALARARQGTNHSRQYSGERKIVPRLDEMLHGRIAQNPEMVLCANMTDFRVSVESNPGMLGGSWAVQLEKICAHAREE